MDLKGKKFTGMDQCCQIWQQTRNGNSIRADFGRREENGSKFLEENKWNRQGRVNEPRETGFFFFSFFFYFYPFPFSFFLSFFLSKKKTEPKSESRNNSAPSFFPFFLLAIVELDFLKKSSIN